MPRKKKAAPLINQGKPKIVFTPRGQQKELLSLIEDKDIILACGPAGTGKSICSVVIALQAYYSGLIDKIMITRPVIEAGERLGFLPGTADEKLHPYLLPIYDQMEKFIAPHEIESLKKQKVLRVEPLAFLRGRSIENAIVLLDEAQNCTWDQLIMVLTRIGSGSKFILNGDPDQSDLPRDKRGAWEWACDNLGKIPEVGVVKFTADGIIRHGVIGKILKVWEERDNENFGTKSGL